MRPLRSDLNCSFLSLSLMVLSVCSCSEPCCAYRTNDTEPCHSAFTHVKEVVRCTGDACSLGHAVACATSRKDTEDLTITEFLSGDGDAGEFTIRKKNVRAEEKKSSSLLEVDGKLEIPDCRVRDDACRSIHRGRFKHLSLISLASKIELVPQKRRRS